MINALQTMLELQDNMNKKVHADWQEQNFAWFRAAWIECGELVDHYGYKWWKKQTPDMAQVQLEVVDIWHFGLSMLLDGRSYSSIAKAIEAELNQGCVESLPVIDATEALACDLLARKQFSVVLFWQLLQACEMTFEQLYKQYVGKNVLNFFRQDHGYKDGSYIKVWQGKEDNEHLFEILTSLTGNEAAIADVVYQQLQNRYPG